MDVIADFAEPLPAIVTAEMLGVPVEDHASSKTGRSLSPRCSATFSTTPTASAACCGRRELTAYFHDAIAQQRTNPREG